jgi:hypothetical protein
LTLSSCTRIRDLLHAIFSLESSDNLYLMMQWVDDVFDTH